MKRLLFSFCLATAITSLLWLLLNKLDGFADLVVGENNNEARVTLEIVPDSTKNYSTPLVKSVLGNRLNASMDIGYRINDSLDNYLLIEMQGNFDERLIRDILITRGHVKFTALYLGSEIENWLTALQEEVYQKDSDYVMTAAYTREVQDLLREESPADRIRFAEYSGGSLLKGELLTMEEVDSAWLGELLRKESLTSLLPGNARLNFSLSSKYGGHLSLYAIKTSEISVDNNDIDKASLTSPFHEELGVEVYFNPAGSKKLEWLTRHNRERPIAITLDKRVISTPVVTNIIHNGHLKLTTNETMGINHSVLTTLFENDPLPCDLRVTSLELQPRLPGTTRSRGLMLALGFIFFFALGFAIFKLLIPNPGNRNRRAI